MDGTVPTADELAAWAAGAPLTEGLLTPFGFIDPEALSQDGRINLMVGLERLKSWVEAQQARVLAAAAADPEPIPTSAVVGDTQRSRADWAVESLRLELACALQWSPMMVAARMAEAEVLVHRLPATLTLLEDGSISRSHARALSEAVIGLDDVTTGKLEQRVLGRAAQQTVAEFRRCLRRGLATLDARGQDEKRAQSAAERRVSVQPGEAAMAWLSAYLPAEDAQTIWLAVHAVAERLRHPGENRTADQLRADALTAIAAAVLRGEPIVGVRDLANLPVWQGRRPAIHVTVALSTLLGLDQQPGELAGYGPIPAAVARRIAADPTGTWHRLVTDPIGHLIDYGRSTYRPPQDLTDHITTRDPTCRNPVCSRPARRIELDHITPWANGGITSADNLHPLCGRDHRLKHIAGWHVERLADGTSRWRTPSGRVHHKPPDRLPIDRTGVPPSRPDPPPF